MGCSLVDLPEAMNDREKRHDMMMMMMMMIYNEEIIHEKKF